jgi:hypothetical protein
MRHTTLGLAVATLLAVAAGQGLAGDMTLARSGDLYRIHELGDELAVTATALDGTSQIYFVPQTAAVAAVNLQIALDETTGTLVVLWQEGRGEDARLHLATYNNGTWFGPMLLAGSPSGSAANPSLLVHRPVTTVENDDVTERVETTMIHLLWWQGLELDDGGQAMYGYLTADDTGLPELDDFAPRPLRDFIPYGIACGAITDATDLAHPQLFLDPQTGDPHALAVDVPSCLFQIIQLRPEVPDRDGYEKRRRHTIVFGRHTMIAINPNLPMLGAKFATGHNLSVVMYWDHADRIDYADLEESGWSEMKSLTLSDTLTRERAIELIRRLAQ